LTNLFAFSSEFIGPSFGGMLVDSYGFAETMTFTAGACVLMVYAQFYIQLQIQAICRYIIKNLIAEQVISNPVRVNLDAVLP